MDTFKIRDNGTTNTQYTQQNLKPEQYAVREEATQYIRIEKKAGEEAMPTRIEEAARKEVSVPVKTEESTTVESAEYVKTERVPEQEASKLLSAEKQEEPIIGPKIIGQAFSTYIVLQTNDAIMLIDQHAAHERIIFEELREKYSKEKDLAQQLIAPVMVELTAQELALLEQEKEFLKGLGFTYDAFGTNSILLRSVPYSSDGGSVKNDFLEIIDNIGNRGRSKSDEVLHSIACKAAVKANKTLGEPEIRALLEKLDKYEDVYTCPHGRPISIQITKQQLEKMFKRVL